MRMLATIVLVLATAAAGVAGVEDIELFLDTGSTTNATMVKPLPSGWLDFVRVDVVTPGPTAGVAVALSPASSGASAITIVDATVSNANLRIVPFDMLTDSAGASAGTNAPWRLATEARDTVRATVTNSTAANTRVRVLLRVSTSGQ